MNFEAGVRPRKSHVYKTYGEHRNYFETCHGSRGVANGKIRSLPRRRDPSLKIRARDLNLFVKSEPEMHLIRKYEKQFHSQTIVVGYPCTIIMT